MSRSSQEASASAFVEFINRHDVPAILDACTADHVFTDSLGATVSGAGNLQRAWQGYFQLFPDYRIEIDTIAASGDTVLLAGFASGSKHGAGAPIWRIPAAWRAVIRHGHIISWQVFADAGPVQGTLHDA